MTTQMLARRGTYRASTSCLPAGRLSRQYQLVVKAYLPDEDANKIVKKVVKLSTAKSKVTFQVPRHVEYAQDVCLIGEDPVLGEWDITKCVPMTWHEGDVWTAEADLPEGTKIEYKYVVRAAEDKGGDVLEWIPSWNLALELSEKELTVRDCWEGESHEVLAGTLPLPIITPASTAATSPMDGQEGATDKVTEVVTAVAEAAATAAAAAVLEAMIDAPSGPEAAAAAANAVSAMAPAAAAAPLTAAAVAAASDEEEEPVPAEQLAGVAAGAVDIFTSDSDFRSGSESDDVMMVEDIAAAVAPAAPPAATSPAAPAVPSRRRGSTEGKGFKGLGSKNAVAAAATHKLGDWSGMATSELKQLCKEHGLPVKGARRDLVARLQQHAA